MQSKYVRLGLVVTALWLVIGGYWSYQRHTVDYHQTLNAVKYLCGTDSSPEYRDNEKISFDQCVENKMKPIIDNMGKLHEWQYIYEQIAIELIVGLALIWSIILGIRWASKAKE